MGTGMWTSMGSRCSSRRLLVPRGVIDRDGDAMDVLLRSSDVVPVRDVVVLVVASGDLCKLD